MDLKTLLSNKASVLHPTVVDPIVTKESPFYYLSHPKTSTPVEAIAKPPAIQAALATRAANMAYHRNINVPIMEASRSLHNHTPDCHSTGAAVAKEFNAWRKKSLKKMELRKKKEEREKERARKKEAKEKAKEEKRKAKEAKKKK